MESPEDQQIYMERWESVKNAPVFSKNYKKDFAQNRFRREQFANIAYRTPIDIVKNASDYIKNMILQLRNKGDVTIDR